MSALPFTGSKISLISKSDIRYVGTLHSINQKESTVSLEQVRSYGTEGRKKEKSEEISGTDQIYEYIVFRGSDIKDLQVCEAPPPTRPQVQVPKDPAILGTTAPSTIPPGLPMMQGFDGNMLPPNLQLPVNPYLIQMYQQQLWQQQLQQQQPAAALLNSNDTPASSANQATNIISAMENLNINKETDKKSTVKSKEETSQSTSKANNDSKTAENSQQSGANNNNNRNPNNTNVGNHNRNYQNNRFQRGGRQNNYRRGMSSRGRRNWNNSKQIPLPDSDFDFESANAKFKELSNKEGDKSASETKKEQTESVNSPEVELPKENGSEEKATGDFYNKSSSFFDNISCESKERTAEQGKKFDRRAKQYEERKLNMETFGQATVSRGGHRGYKRNNYHSYRGGRNNYNRNGGYHRNNGYRNNYYNRQKNQDQQPQQNQNNQSQQPQQKQETTKSQ